MLPDAEDGPTPVSQGYIVSPVASHVRHELGYPVVHVRLRLSSVIGTAVPEAAINKHRKLSSRKADVHSNPVVKNTYCMVLEEPDSTPVEVRTKGDFDRCVGPSVASADLCRRC